jgi:multidrug efflux pump subunit AcrA (membrane-fusion protein)
MKKKIVIIVTGIAVILAAFFLLSGSKEKVTFLTVEARRGPFEVLVYTTGQLEAENSENILAPEELGGRNVRIYEIKITDLIEEGTQVEKGDYVASLDHKAVEEVLANAMLELEQALNEFEDAKMDSNLNLSNARDQIVNAREQVEQMQIILEESKFESPAVIRKAEMDLEKAKRSLDQEIKGYALRQQQSATRVNRSQVNLNQREARVRELEEAYKSLNIYAPKSGMLIYAKDRFGQKIRIGATVSRWMPIIATLPDLSQMISITYVNEIDISKVQPGQQVTLGIDAFPEKVLNGEVITVANIGQPIPRSDAKVFEVRIRVFGNDPELRPAMTTSNVIRTGSFSDEIYIPSDAIFQNDSVRYVYLQKNNTITRQIIDAADENENFTIVRKGIDEGDKLLINRPDHSEELPFAGLDILEEIRKREAEQVREDNQARNENQPRNETRRNGRQGDRGNNQMSAGQL